MRQFTNMPYQWNGAVKKNMQKNGHPFAYMDLTGQNITIAQNELAKMNEQLTNDSTLSRSIPKGIHIPIREITFKASKTHGYTRLMCTPFTFTGQISKYPASLFFTTKDEDENDDSTHGELFYGQDGNIKKAEIYFWEKFNGWFFYYDTVGETLTLSKVEIPLMNEQGQRRVIYKGAHILEREAQLAREEKDYAWLQAHIPNLCPKSISGFRRMKSQNTKNYQKIVVAAEALGYIIE